MEWGGFLKTTGIVLIVFAFMVNIAGLNLLTADRAVPSMIGSHSKNPSYDVVVVGAEPEGIAAAIGAARSGAKVLLLEKRARPGGLFTLGWLNSLDMNYGPGSELLTRGIFEEFFHACGGTSFDVGEALSVFQGLLARESNITTLYGVSLVEPVLDDRGSMVAVSVGTPEGKKIFQGACFVDATQDADLAAMAGVPFTVGREDHGVFKTMAATLVFQLADVDWNELRKALENDGDTFTNSDITSAWGFWTEMSRYSASSPRLRVRGLNIGRQKDGSILINALTIFGVDGLNPASCDEGYRLAKEEIPGVVSFMRENIPCFAKAKLVACAPELYVRETRHIKGEYVLSIDDVLGNRYFEDEIAVGSYPVDIQATDPSNYGWAFGRPVMYSIPLRCLVPRGVDGLLVTGRSASYSSLAAGSARVVPIGMGTGQAAGVAAAKAAKDGVSPRLVALDPVMVKEVQAILRLQGAYLPSFSLSHAVADHWAYPAIKDLQRLALVSSGYDNQYHLEDPLSLVSFDHLALTAFQRTYPGILPRNLFNNGSQDQVKLGQAIRSVEVLLRYYHPQYLGSFILTNPRLSELPADTALVQSQAYTLLSEALDLSQRLHRFSYK